jgi:hypothetical protein
MRSITLGDVTVTRITEWEGCAPITAQLAPEGGGEVWERHGSWLAPRFWDRESNEVVTCSASYLVRSAGKIILIDTASGNGKERPYFPLSSTPRYSLHPGPRSRGSLPAQIRRQLSDEEMGHYRQPFVVKRRTLMYRSV